MESMKEMRKLTQNIVIKSNGAWEPKHWEYVLVGMDREGMLVIDFHNNVHHIPLVEYTTGYYWIPQEGSAFEGEDIQDQDFYSLERF